MHASRIRGMALLAAFTVGLPVRTVAAVPPASAGPAAPAAPEGSGSAAAQHRVTLLTGDVVTVVDRGGRPQFTVEPAQRADRRPVTFEAHSGDTIAGAADFYVIPSDARPQLAAGRLDKELFNVKELVREGWESADTLPLIVTPAPDGRAAPLAGVRTTRSLPAIGASVVRVDRSRAAAFWASVRAGPVALISVDHRRKLSLDWSVPQIGAPAAWRAGFDGTGVTVAVIDSGIDTTHPDLAGKVVAAKNFTGEPDTGDGLGHGTHVASIIAGTGAASGGRYRGVAPGAKLVNAKACEHTGYCFDSAILPAMEFAAHSGATVVNMSLGGGASDGTDELSAAVDRLTAQTGVLFVVAAGNSGDDGPLTIEAPGAAASALTVGAVDRSDRLASFSGRGPRLGDAAVKPDLTAPGVGIVAARAAGTDMGKPVDSRYTAASGTSMATPHVAGAAAILAGEHPTWTAGRLKAALVSTAKPGGYKEAEQGTGRVDVAHAFSATVFGPQPVTFGRLTGDRPAVRPVTYTNDGDHGVLLSLTVAGTGWNGKPIPTGGLRLLGNRVWVPAHGTASAYLLAQPGRSGTGAFAATVIATGPGVNLRTTAGLYVTTPTVPLTVTVVDHDGRTTPPAGRTSVLWDNVDPVTNNDPFAQVRFDVDDAGTAQVPKGTYTASTSLFEDGLTLHRSTIVTRTDVPVSGATSVTLDMRQTAPATIGAREPVDTRRRFFQVTRQLPYAFDIQAFVGFADWPVYVSPAAPARHGTVVFQDTATLVDHLADIRAGGRAVTARFDPYRITARWTGDQRVPLIDAGHGTDADFAKVDVKDKIALVGVTVPPGSTDPWFDAYLAASDADKRAAAAGAKAVVTYADQIGALSLQNLSDTPIPQIAVSQADGMALRGVTALDIHARATPSFIYNLHYSQPNGIAANQTHVASRLTTVRSRYHADVPGLVLRRAYVAFRKGVSAVMTMPAVDLPAPAQVDEYVGGSPDAISAVDWTRFASLYDGKGNLLTMYQRTAFTPTEDWFAGPLTVGAFDPRFAAFYRIGVPGGGDWLRPSEYFGDSTPGHLLSYNAGAITPVRWTLSRDGLPIPPDASIPSLIPYFPVPDETAVYRLAASLVLPATSPYEPSLAVRRMSPVVDTDWTFHSPGRSIRPCPGDPRFTCATQSLLQIGYDLGLDLVNRAPAGEHAIGVRIYDSATGAPVAAKAVTVRYSTDEGATWRPARMNGTKATVTDPDHGYVWLSVAATDNAGNSVEQTVQRAYAVG